MKLWGFCNSFTTKYSNWNPEILLQNVNTTAMIVTERKVRKDRLLSTNHKVTLSPCVSKVTMEVRRDYIKMPSPSHALSKLLLLRSARLHVTALWPAMCTKPIFKPLSPYVRTKRMKLLITDSAITGLTVTHLFYNIIGPEWYLYHLYYSFLPETHAPGTQTVLFLPTRYCHSCCTFWKHTKHSKTVRWLATAYEVIDHNYLVSQQILTRHKMTKLIKIQPCWLQNSATKIHYS